MDALDPVATWPVDHAAVAVATFTPSPPTGAPEPPPATATPDPPRLVGTTGPVGRTFEWASVTKLATTLAVLVAVEEGTLRLDEPAGPPGATVRHLLAHTSGLGPEPGPTLARPGTRRIYSNAGFQVLGELLAHRAGMPFAHYLAEGVLGPLGMDDTALDPDGPAGAAAGLHGPLADLARLGMEWAVPTLLGGALHRQARSVQFPGLSGVVPGFGRFDPCDWGLGVELRDDKHPHWTGTANDPAAYGHFGRSGSFLWIDPRAGVLCAGLADRPFGPWAATAWPALADRVLAAPARPGPGGHQ